MWLLKLWSQQVPKQANSPQQSAPRWNVVVGAQHAELSRSHPPALRTYHLSQCDQPTFHTLGKYRDSSSNARGTVLLRCADVGKNRSGEL